MKLSAPPAVLWPELNIWMNPWNSGSETNLHTDLERLAKLKEANPVAPSSPLSAVSSDLVAHLSSSSSSSSSPSSSSATPMPRLWPSAIYIPLMLRALAEANGGSDTLASSSHPSSSSSHSSSLSSSEAFSSSSSSSSSSLVLPPSSNAATQAVRCAEWTWRRLHDDQMRHYRMLANQVTPI